MDSKIEKKIGKEMGKKVVKDIQKEIDKEVEKEVKKEVEKEVEAVKKEVEKRLHLKLYESTRQGALRFGNEFRKHVITGVTAAFAFLIALSWRTPIQNSVNSMIINMGLTGKQVYIEYLSAMAITLLAVLVLMLVSNWEVKKSKK